MKGYRSGKKGNTVVYGILETRSEVETTIDLLKMHGFRGEDISVLMSESEGWDTLAIEKGSKLPEGAATGAASGAVVGGAFGWLVGIGSLAIPGLGPFLAAGPIMAALAGATIGGALGGLSGALVGVGIPEYEAKRYETYVKEGGILISVHADDLEWARHAEQLLKDVGARDVASTQEIAAPGLGRKDSHAAPPF